MYKYVTLLFLCPSSHPDSRPPSHRIAVDSLLCGVKPLRFSCNAHVISHPVVVVSAAPHPLPRAITVIVVHGNTHAKVKAKMCSFDLETKSGNI
jgi:hypothetical protein